MIELLEKPCFIWIGEENNIHSCNGHTESEKCPVWGQYGVNEWENCMYGKASVRYKAYIDIQTDRLRNYFAKGAMDALINRANHEFLFSGEANRQTLMTDRIAKDAFKMADEMIQAKFKDVEERRERSKTRKLEVEE